MMCCTSRNVTTIENCLTFVEKVIKCELNLKRTLQNFIISYTFVTVYIMLFLLFSDSRR